MVAQPALEPKLINIAAQFLMCFSRLEFSLKENGYFSRGRYQSAQVDWRRFYHERAADYVASKAGDMLAQLDPHQQIVDKQGVLSWTRRSDLVNCPTLQRNIELLKTVRNNLFHGGKHGGDSVQRTADLLQVSIQLMDELGSQFFLMDYTGSY